MNRFFRKVSSAGFSLVELLLFAGIFAFVSVAFVSIFIVITRIQSRETSVVQINQESQFFLQTAQRLVEESSLIEMNPNQPTSTIKLRMKTLSLDPTYIYVTGGRAYVRQGSGAAQALTSERVAVAQASFVKKPSPGGKDSVSLSFTLEPAFNNKQNFFSQKLSTSIARVSAATFDSDIRASTTSMYRLGAAAAEWLSINNTLFFSTAGSKVGINASPDGGTANNSLEVNGGVRFNNTISGVSTSSLGCSSSVNRGMVWFVPQTSATDTLVVCLKNGRGTYVWMPLH